MSNENQVLDTPITDMKPTKAKTQSQTQADKRTYPRGRTVDQMIDEVQEHATSRYSKTVVGEYYLARQIGGDNLWTTLSAADQKTAGRCIVRLVKHKRIPFESAGHWVDVAIYRRK